MGFSSEFPGCFSCLSFLWSSSWRKFTHLERHIIFSNMAQCLDVHGYFRVKSCVKTKNFLTANRKTFQPRKSLPFWSLGRALHLPSCATHCMALAIPVDSDTGIATSILPHCQICQMLGCWHFGVCSLKAAQFAWKFCICTFSRKKCTVTVHFRDKTHDILLTLSCTSRHKKSGAKPISMSGCLMLFLGSSTRGSCEAVFPSWKPTAGETSNRSVFKLPTYPLWSVLRKWWPFACSWSGC